MSHIIRRSVLALVFSFLNLSSAMAGELVWHPVSTGFVNSSNISGATNFMAAETALCEEAFKICGTGSSSRIWIRNLTFAIPESNGRFSLTAEGCAEATAFCKQKYPDGQVTIWSPYPRITASAEVACVAN